MATFKAIVVGGGPYDGYEIHTDYPPRHGTLTVADGLLYKFNDQTCRWVFQGQQAKAKRIE